jgi:hypothetical protein
MDRRLYLPKDWADDADRRAVAGVPEEVEFATKPELATLMITEALDAGTHARWASGDEVYGADPALASCIPWFSSQARLEAAGRHCCGPCRWQVAVAAAAAADGLDMSWGWQRTQ